MTTLQWKSVSQQIIGRGHEVNGEPCQDRAKHFHMNGMHGIVVCDGAGSCKYSEQGAEAVTEAMANVTADMFDEWYAAPNTAVLMERFILDVLDEQQQFIEGSTLMDFSCTLLAVIVKGNRYIAAHVGDGVISARQQGEVFVLSHPENGRYSNETYFVTMTPLHDHFRVYKDEIQSPIDFMLMTDGTAISFYIHSKKEMAMENTTMLFEHLTENEAVSMQAELADFMELLKKNTSDDCAIALLVSHRDVASNDPFDDSYEEEEDFNDNDYEDDGYITETVCARQAHHQAIQATSLLNTDSEVQITCQTEQEKTQSPICEEASKNDSLVTKLKLKLIVYHS